MKKLLAHAICFLFVFSTTPAMASEAPSTLMELSGTLALCYVYPEGIKDVSIRDVYTMKIVTFHLEKEKAPTYVMVISYNDELHEKDMSDLSVEEITDLVVMTASDSEEHSFTISEMPDGRPAVLVQYEGVSDWVDAFTVISGHLIQIHGAYADFSRLTDADNMYALTLLNCISLANDVE